MATIATLVVSLEANVAKFVTGIDKANTILQKMQKSLNLIKFDALVNLGSRAVNTAERIYGMAKSVANAGNEIQRNSKIVGMSADEYQRWSFAAKMSDVEAGSLSAAMRILSKNMEEVSQGTGEAKKYFDAMGISVKDSSGKLKSLTNIMKEIASKFSSWQDGPAKIAYAMNLMGRSAQEVIPLFNEGAEGIDNYMKKASVLNDEMLDTASRMDETFKLWEESAKGWAFKTLTWIDSVIEGIRKYRTLAGGLEFSIATGLRKKPAAPEYPQYEPGPYYPQAALPPLIANKEAADAFKKALEKAAAAEAKMNAMFPDDAYNLRMMEKEIDRIAEAEGEIDRAHKSIDNLKNLKVYYQEGKLSVIGYVQSLTEALALQNKLTDKAYYDEKLSAEEEYQQRSREINREEEGWRKKENALIDEYFKRMKEVETLKIPTHADVVPLEKEVEEAIRKMSEKKIYLEVHAKDSFQDWSAQWGTGTSAMGGGETIDTLEEWAKAAKGAVSGVRQEIEDANDSFQDWSTQWGEGLDFPVMFTGIGSTKKPIIDKINEIINAFGGIEEAASALEASIDFSAISGEITKLEYKMKTMEQAVPGISSIVQKTESGWWINPTAPLWAQEYAATTILDLKSQMAQLQGQLNLATLQMYGGSMQTGGIVPRTGLYTLHEGEQVISKTTNNALTININEARNARQTAEEVEMILKKHMSGSLRDTIRSVR